MKKIVATLLFVCTLIGGALLAQTVPQGINYQAVARDASGMPIANQDVTVRVSLGTADMGTDLFFAETHEVVTDAAGYFRIVIGRGAAEKGILADVPWADEQVWLNLEMYDNRVGGFRVLSTNELLSVPYAFYAERADRLVDDQEINLRTGSSIYWTTTGNNFTRPPFHFLGTRDNQPLYFKTNNETRMVITANGQTQIISGVSGNEGDYNAYPLTIQNSRQGIYIKVNGGRSSETNFVTFADGGPGVGPGMKWGEIEGQTLPELLGSFDYIFQNVVFGIQIASLIAQSVATGIEVGGLLASTFGAAAAIGAAANVVALAANAASLGAQIGAFNANAIASVGVSYSSGAGDYAEWLERAEGVRDLKFGEVVGIRGGKVSLDTRKADHLLVVSMRPIVLGNAPQPDREADFEKVAFMGQVPVKVTGAVNRGDYIIPSGNDDGVGIAVKPEDMQAGDYSRIIGVAWEEAPAAPLNYVNVAVGINANDLSQKVAELNRKVDNIMAYLEGTEPLLTEDGSEQVMVKNTLPQTTTMTKLITDEEFDRFVEENEVFFTMAFDQAKEKLIKQGHNIDDIPGLRQMFDDPVTFMKAIRRDPMFTTQWGFVDQQINNGGND